MGRGFLRLNTLDPRSDFTRQSDLKFSSNVLALCPAAPLSSTGRDSSVRDPKLIHDPGLSAKSAHLRLTNLAPKHLRRITSWYLPGSSTGISGELKQLTDNTTPQTARELASSMQEITKYIWV
ncbi:uncharacterized protein N7496_010788 [Penicillium cataractarum]|uniref:Uncharacterized protein n=1 Tax=Penicillium cataractarum TaxID=2100454 RepID=A0A9W9UX11_9EURO|nr:uncharacterized protein N7496_010788 [Penicillium cataractarum]KAJ5358375.1 hypothetical protein N7496_010788 [Penicillium cataractarum]